MNPPRPSPAPLSDFFVVIYVALTTVMLAYGGLLGFTAILLVYALWLPKIVYKGAFLLRPTKDVVFAFLLPSLAIVSTIWSDYPAHSLYSSFEYTSLIICIVIMSKIVRIAAFIRGLVLGSTLTLIASLISGKYGLDPLTGQYILIGLFGSKNMIGIFAEIGIVLSLLSLYVRQRIIEKIIFAIIPIGICAVSLYWSKSASSVLTLVLTLVVVVVITFISKLPRALRMITLMGCMMLAIIIAVIGTAYDVQDIILESFGKNSTLTGRTYLWNEGMATGMQAPVLGHGYAAFWVEGRPKAEQLWQKFDVATRIGFHFHNLFIETFVELGLVGVLIVVLLMLSTCWKSMRLILRYGMSIEYAYALSVSFMFLARAMVEVDIIGTFSIGPVLFFSVFPRLAGFKPKTPAGIMPLPI